MASNQGQENGNKDGSAKKPKAEWNDKNLDGLNALLVLDESIFDTSGP